MEHTQVITYAGFWKRFVAYIIDSIVMGVVQSIFLLPLWIMFGVSLFPFHEMERWENFDSVALANVQLSDDEFSVALFSVFFIGILVVSLISIVVQWLYFALMESSSKQATLGKMALGIIVTDLDGNRISFGRASGRYFGKILSGLILCIGYIMAGFSEKKQALHDMIAGCLVINQK